MRVGLNTLPLKSGHESRGIGNYTKNLIQGLTEIGVEVVEFGELNSLKSVDVVHYPYFDLGFATLPLRKKFPTVVTIHDVTPLVFPAHYPLGIRGRINFERQRLALKGVKAVVTDSECSRKDIKQFLKVQSAKIFPIYLAAGSQYKQIKSAEILNKTKRTYNLPDNFMLYVGDVNWNKNLLGMAEACQKSGITLVMVGKNFNSRSDLSHPERASFKQFLEKYESNPLFKVLGFVPEPELVAIYNLASMLLLPSFYEGFGLTILEAQSCGVPVITSDVSSMPEVAGEGALLINPENSSEIAEAIDKLLTDRKLREQQIKLGFVNVERFDWQKTARLTLEVYQHAIDQKTS